MVGIALHQSSVIVTSLYMALIISQWVSDGRDTIPIEYTI